MLDRSILLTAALLAAGPAAAQTAMRATEADAATSLGVTVGQVQDADLVDASGRELGEVEAVLLDGAGQPGSVLVELEDDVFPRERLVEIQLADLDTQPDDELIDFWDDEIDLVTSQSINELEALPDWGAAR